MKIALSRSKPGFWALYFAVHFCFLMLILLVFRYLWAVINSYDYVLDLGEMAFESACYAVIITVVKIIRYIIGKKRYEKNPQDRRRNNLFRE